MQHSVGFMRKVELIDFTLKAKFSNFVSDRAVKTYEQTVVYLSPLFRTLSTGQRGVSGQKHNHAVSLSSVNLSATDFFFKF